MVRLLHSGGAAQRGMTLIELMIVVAIVAIIAAVGYPSYQDHIRKARRAEGKSALLKALQLQERAYTANQQYATDMGPLFGTGTNGAVRSGENPATGHYALTAAADPASGSDLAMGVLITATPTGGFTDPDCNVLTITSTGVRTASGTKGTAFCWER